MNFKLVATIPSQDWARLSSGFDCRDKPEHVIETDFSADSWEEAEAIAIKLCLIPDETMPGYLIPGEYDYNWCIDPDLVEWSKLAYILADEYSSKPTSIYLRESSPSRDLLEPITKAFDEQNKMLLDEHNKAEKLAQNERRRAGGE